MHLVATGQNVSRQSKWIEIGTGLGCEGHEGMVVPAPS
jgi:hypothetical protein